MNSVVVGSDYRTAQISGGARASDLLAVTDPRGLAVVTGSCSSVGMTGLTLGGGYGSLIGRFGLALDNLLSAEVVLADGRIVTARPDSEEELFWALRGGGGNFGVVTAMEHRVHVTSCPASAPACYFSRSPRGARYCKDAWRSRQLRPKS
jgi:FAD/FMN-containing dehydrogenase